MRYGPSAAPTLGPCGNTGARAPRGPADPPPPAPLCSRPAALTRGTAVAMAVARRAAPRFVGHLVHCHQQWRCGPLRSEVCGTGTGRVQRQGHGHGYWHCTCILPGASLFCCRTGRRGGVGRRSGTRAVTIPEQHPNRRGVAVTWVPGPGTWPRWVFASPYVTCVLPVEWTRRAYVTWLGSSGAL